MRTANDDQRLRRFQGGFAARLLKRFWRHNRPERLQDFDLEFYRSFYPDLAHLDASAAARHWREFGIKEERFPNLDRMLAKLSPESARIPETFDWRVYLALYADLGRAGLSTRAQAVAHFLRHGSAEGRCGDFNEDFYTAFYPDLGIFRGDREAAIDHWLAFGRSEGRSPTLRHYATTFGLPARFVPDEIEWGGQGGWNDGNDGNDGNVAAGDSGLRWGLLAQAYSQVPPGIIPVWTDAERNIDFYLELAAAYGVCGGDAKAREIYLGLIGNHDGATVHEGLANIAVRASWRKRNHLHRERQQLLALAHYRKALQHNPMAVTSKLGIARALSETFRHQAAVDQALQALAEHPDTSQAESTALECAVNYWWSEWASIDMAASIGGRQAVYDTAADLASRVFEVTRQVVTRGDAKRNTARCTPNGERVLLVADLNLPQCVRYRIEQKMEQLAAAGYRATSVSWMRADDALQQLAFHDLVIFYRVPAFPEVVRLIATAQALGKVTFFEIDDYVFDPMYPPPIETYGGYVGPEQYLGLVKGGALFRAAARLCEFGIASTEPLSEHLGRVVRSGRSFLHRNGLDRLTPTGLTADVADESAGINIFYGSATYAHNSDFLDEALPAIARILEEHPKARLTIAGYLQLPQAFKLRFGDRLEHLPMTEDIQAYWDAMSKSHVNIAVLKPDVLTDCKSELKWFEAAAMGIPVIVSPTRNYLDVVSDGKDALIASGVDGWHRALEALVTDAAARVRIGNAARQRVLEHYSIEPMAANLAGIFAQACATRNGADDV